MTSVCTFQLLGLAEPRIPHQHEDQFVRIIFGCRRRRLLCVCTQRRVSEKQRFVCFDRAIKDSGLHSLRSINVCGGSKPPATSCIDTLWFTPAYGRLAANDAPLPRGPAASGAQRYRIFSDLSALRFNLRGATLLVPRALPPLQRHLPRPSPTSLSESGNLPQN